MASLSSAPNGRRTIQFVAGDGKRRTIRLGKVPMKVAETIRTHVAHLAVGHWAETPVGGEAARWLAEIDDTLREKLAAVGLVSSRKKAGKLFLVEFIKSYVATRSDVKPATKEVWRQGELGLVNFFGANRSLSSITPGDADRYKLQLIAD